MTTQTITRPAAHLNVGDRIADGFLPPTREPAEVVFVHPYQLGTSAWVFVAYTLPGGAPDSDRWLADAQIPLEAIYDPAGLGYSREADDPTPVSPARVPLHTGYHSATVTDEGEAGA
jgi:hypothetical protein